MATSRAVGPRVRNGEGKSATRETKREQRFGKSGRAMQYSLHRATIPEEYVITSQLEYVEGESGLRFFFELSAAQVPCLEQNNA